LAEINYCVSVLNTIAIYVRGRTALEQLGVKRLAQGHIGVSHGPRCWDRLQHPCNPCKSGLENQQFRMDGYCVQECLCAV